MDQHITDPLLSRPQDEASCIPAAETWSPNTRAVQSPEKELRRGGGGGQ